MKCQNIIVPLTFGIHGLARREITYVISPVQVIFHSRGDPVDNVSLECEPSRGDESSVGLTDFRG